MSTQPTWDGDRWIYAISADGDWHFDGSRWIPTVSPHRSRLPQSLRRWRTAWLVVSMTWLPVGLGVLLTIDPKSRHQTTALWALGVPAMVSTLVTAVCGFALGRHRLWSQIRPSDVWGTAALLAGFVITSAISDTYSPHSGADDAAAAGTMLLAIPAGIVVASTLALGAITAQLGSLPRRRHNR